MPPRLHRINVIFLYVSDLQRARHFYETIVGFGPPLVSTDDWMEFGLPGGTHFALHRTTPEALQGGNPLRNTLHFSIVVGNLREACREMRAAGVEFSRTPEKGHGFELAEFMDPEGNLVRMIQYEPPA